MQQTLDHASRKSAFFLAIGSLLWVLIAGPAISVNAQTAGTDASAAAGLTTAANLVRWSGSLPDAAGKTVDLSFALFQDSAGGLALWNEAQPVKVGADGRYSVLLGSTSADGLPQSLFQAGEARWIEAKPVAGLSPDAATEAVSVAPHARSLLTAVPYAFKSVDAETLAGRSAGDYVTREDLQSTVANQVKAISEVTRLPLPVTGWPSEQGSVGYLPVWTARGTLGNSIVAQSNTSVGIGTPSPATMLDVNGASTLRGTVSLLASAATLAAGINSPALQLGASTYSSATQAAVPQNFIWQAAPSGNNTANPTANLALLFGTGSEAPTPTGLAIAPNGHITFAPGQTFPGVTTGTGSSGTSGTITAVTAGPGLTGGGSTGNVTLALSGPISTANGGTGAATPAAALASLGGASIAGAAFTGAVSVPSLNGIIYASPTTAGTTTAGINEALDSFGAAPACGTIVLPFGVYNISSTIGATHTRGRQGCIIQGQGAHDTYSGGGTVLRWKGAANGTMMDIQNCYYCQSKDFVLDGSSIAGVGHSTSAQSGQTLLSYGNLVENVEVENIKGTPGNEFQLVSPPGLMVDQTTYRHIIGGNSPTCMYLSGVNTTDTTVYGQSGCNSTSYGIYLAPGTAISVYDMEFSGSATLFYVDNSSMGLTCTNCYSESFKTFLTANGVSNKTGPPHIAFYSSGFNSNSSGVIGTYTQNGTLSFHNSGLNSSSNGASFMFNPIGTRGHGYTGLLITDGMKWGNITLNNAGATSGTGQMISNDTFGGEVGGNSWYSRAALITGASPSIYDGRPMGYINSPITEADGVSSNVFSHYPSFSGGKAEYGWFLNQALEGGWNQAGSPAQGEWDAGVVNATSEYKLGGRTVLPTTLTGFHGTSGTKVQLSDGTGTKGNIAIFASDGSITNGPSAALPVTGGTVTGATMFDQGIDVHSGYGLVNGDVGGGITVGSDAGVNVINGSKITFAKFTSGGLSLGTDYAKTTPPTNGAIIQGNVGVGTSSPSALLSVGRGSPFQVDGNGVVHQNGHVPSASIGTIIGTNAAGYVSGIAGATSLTINFANSGWTTWVSCVANSSVPATQPYVKSISKTGVTFGFLPLRGTLYYHCDGN